MNEITQVLTEEQAKELATQWLSEQDVYKRLTKTEIKQFVDLASVYKLNPLKREVYAVKFKDQMNIIIGFEVYLKRAQRTGLLNGFECHTEGSGNDIVAIATIHRKDWDFPFTHDISIKEFRGTSPIWSKMPAYMLKKCCLSQAFRLCFPDELGGTYTAEEHSLFDRQDEIDTSAIVKEAEKIAPAKENGDTFLSDIRAASQDNDGSACRKYLSQLKKQPDKKVIKTEAIILDTPPQSAPVNDDLVQLRMTAQGGAEKVFTNANHKKASVKKHLGVDEIDQCHDAELLEAYIKRLRLTWRVANSTELTDDDRKSLAKSLSDCPDDLLHLNQFEVDLNSAIGGQS